MRQRAGVPAARFSPAAFFRCVLAGLSAPACAACEGPRLGLDLAVLGTANEMARVGWGMLTLIVGLLALVTGAWAWARARQARPLPPDEERRAAQRLFVLGSLLLPTLNIAILLVVGVPTAQRLLVLQGKNALRIELLAYGEGWRVHYPAVDCVLEDELLLPRGRAVELQVESAEGVHSLWLPPLGRQIEAVPGKITTLRGRAERLGVFGGRSPDGPAGLRVVVLEPEVFAARLAKRSP